ncbi:MAG TPA: glycosyltransferase family A protein [Planctomycetota bacterium]
MRTASDTTTGAAVAGQREGASAVAGVECVVIGRNEAARLQACLQSVLAQCRRVVYVDSGSSDGSVAIAKRLGVDVLELDRGTPFSAARARNEGFALLRRRDAGDGFCTQFVDGDCCLASGWLQAGAQALQRDPALGVVTGRSREEVPAASPYNLLCDIELDVPAGAIDECGGVAMFRTSALVAAGGFDATFAAGEEPELCLRLRRLGWRLQCLAAPMMRHDAAMHSWRQWWARSMRNGRACAESWWRHRGGPERFRAREVARMVVWGALAPALALGAVAAYGVPGLMVAAAAAWPARGAYRLARRRGRVRAESCFYAFACVAGKLPELLGVLQFARRLRLTTARSRGPARPH